MSDCKGRQIFDYIWCHLCSTSSPYFFILIMDELTRHIQDDTLWCMLLGSPDNSIDNSIDRIPTRSTKFDIIHRL